MSCSIMRVDKLKSGAAISGRLLHNKREQEVENANPEIENLVLKEGNFQDVMALVEQAEFKRQGSVLAFEILLTSDKKFFEVEGNQEKWAQANLDYLNKTYGEKNVVSVVLHLDETTPHIQAIVVPLDEKNHLNAKQWTGGFKKIRQLQDNYNTAMNEAGLQLERGKPVEETCAKHQHIQVGYKNINGAMKSTKFLAEKIEEAIDKIEPASKWTRVSEEKTHEHYTEAFRKNIRPNIAYLASAIEEKNKLLTNEIKVLKRQNTSAEKGHVASIEKEKIVYRKVVDENSELKIEVKNLKGKIEHKTRELDSFKGFARQQTNLLTEEENRRKKLEQDLEEAKKQKEEILAVEGVKEALAAQKEADIAGQELTKKRAEEFKIAQQAQKQALAKKDVLSR